MLYKLYKLIQVHTLGAPSSLRIIRKHETGVVIVVKLQYLINIPFIKTGNKKIKLFCHGCKRSHRTDHCLLYSNIFNNNGL